MMVCGGACAALSSTMHKRPPHYLRALRKQLPLTQDELALLLGLASQGMISRYEYHGTLPPTQALIRSEIVFGRPLADLFPQAYDDAEAIVLRRARTLIAALSRRTDRISAQKISVLTDLVQRIEKNKSTP